MYLYITGSWEATKRINECIAILKKSGYKVKNNSNYTGNSDKAKNDKILGISPKHIDAIKYLDDIKRAFALVIVTNDQYVFRGSSTELGIALVSGIPVFIINNNANTEKLMYVYMHHPMVSVIPDIDELIKLINPRKTLSNSLPNKSFEEKKHMRKSGRFTIFQYDTM